ncbi:MAG: 30S ribosomal protein S9 [Candidatus Aenigmatarchaeota archaeon]
MAEEKQSEKTKTDEKKIAAKKEKPVFAVGNRKVAKARAILVKGSGKIVINSIPLGIFEPALARDMISEPLILAVDAAKQVDISVTMEGGGIMGQAEAARQAIAKSLAEFDKNLMPVFLQYDRSMVVADPRRNEPHKPSRSKDGPRRHKQRSKR